MVQLLCHSRMITEEEAWATIVVGLVNGIAEEAAGEALVEEEDTEGILTSVMTITAG